MKVKSGILGLSILVAGLMIGCNDNSQNVDQEPAGPGKVVINITDAPFPSELVAEANVTIDWIKIGKLEPQNEEMEFDQFHTVELAETTTFNLLELSNGVTAFLGEAELPDGEYNEIRMHVVDAQVVLTDGTVYDLKIPSGNASGLKVRITPAIVVSEGTTSEVLLDFDVSRSFVARGNMNNPNGKDNFKGFIFKPVVRAVNDAVSGRIMGVVKEQDGDLLMDAIVALVVGNDTVTTALTNDQGYYAIVGIPEGVYALECGKEGYEDVVVDPVEVAPGDVFEHNFELVKETVTE